MLQSIRNLFTGWIAVLFVVLLIVPFAFWGIDSYFGSGANINAASVDGEDISLVEYQQSFQNIRQQMQRISPALAEQVDFIKQQTIDQLVNRRLLLSIRDELGLRINNEQLRTAISQIPAFRNPEGFDIVAYRNYLLSSGYTESRFETELRQDMTLDQLQSALLATTIITPAETGQLAALERQQRDITYALISHDAMGAGLEISDDEIQSYYEANTAEYQSPEEVTLAYIHLSIDSVADEVSVTEVDLAAYFDAHSDSYSVPERRKIRQILVYAESDNEASREQAAAVAADIRAQVAAGGLAFEDVRDRFSNDAVTVETSDFGYLNKGVLDTVIDEVAFALEPGVISEPVLSDYGYQLLIVDDITGGGAPELADVRGEVETDYRRQEAEGRFFELYDELARLTYEHPDTLEIAAETLGLPIQQAENVNRYTADVPVLNNPKVFTAAFSDEVLLNGNNSEMLELDTNDVLVLRVLEHREQQTLPLADVRDTIRERLKFERSAELARQRGEEIIARLEQGADREALAAEYTLTWIDVPGATRIHPSVDRQIITTAFQAGKPSTGGQIMRGTALTQGDYAVVAVTAVHEIDPATLSEDELAQVRLRMQQTRATSSWSGIMEDLRSRADVQINEANL